MGSMRNWLWCFLLTSLLLCGTEFQLKERLEKAKSGDYIVTEANKMVTVLSIRSISKGAVVIEEISAPVQNLKQSPSSWADWIKAKAPGHTSWSMIEIDLQKGGIAECYSFSRATWIHLCQKESLFATLLQLPLKKIAEHERRKIGLPPMNGDPDVRKNWNPPLIYEGQKLENVSFDVFQATWPEDGTELANQEVFLYFDKESRFPLPFWIQVQTSHITAVLRTIDSGKNLPLVHQTLPKRTPEFVGLPVKTKKGLSLSVKCPKYYQTFELFAVDITGKEKQILPITHSLVQGEEEWLSVEIEEEDLQHTLESDHRYTWLLVPHGHSESYTQSTRPFVWTPGKN